MTEKNIFACKLFLSLNISDFNFLCENCNNLWKKSPPSFPANPCHPLSFFENLVGGSIPPPSSCRKREVHNMACCSFEPNKKQIIETSHSFTIYEHNRGLHSAYWNLHFKEKYMKTGSATSTFHLKNQLDITCQIS